MNLHFNNQTIIDLVLDHVLGYEQLKTIVNEMYEHRRSDKYSELFESDEFMNELTSQLEMLERVA